jgi:hypothetical protein
MKITVFAFALFLLQFTFANELFAQKGKNEIAIGAEIGPVIDDFTFSYQYGLPVKAYLGIGTSGQLMLRSGIHSFQVSNLFEAWESINMYMIPVALGYRQNLNKFYIEPSIGAARSMHTHVLANPRETYRSSENEIHYGLEFGYQINRIDLGASINNTGHPPVGSKSDSQIFFGFKALYRLQL